MPHEDRIAEEEQRAKDGYQLIRMRLERLQQNIDKPAPIPTKKDTIRKPKAPPEFVRNVVGSSAAAGSAEFHIYRNNRRKEQERLDYIDKVAKKEEEEEKYKVKREIVEKEEEERTARKRIKNQKRKEQAKKARMAKKGKRTGSGSDSDSDSEGDDDDEVEEASEHDGGDGERDGQGAAAPAAAAAAAAPAVEDTEESKEE
ncbi:hypothetical protein PENTCL1PPCAC_13553 [Pristionchus entomophagus]|uniref:Uncharacterized protein n=1 Tax=Pristionchus entomophagus TaxID=358040 RepID=A0AAV5TEL1_9BILA|nr:hypothetical protein PENTCL1PPCAC_13553 [Pristionchus entomophagus]